MDTQENRILVIGAGVAGLAAARRLAEAGRQVLVLEARDRVGGRVRTLREEGEILELGAEFIHGRPPELWELVEEAGLETYEVEGRNLRSKGGRFRKGEDDGDTFQFLSGLEKWKGPDLALADYPALARLPAERREEIIRYVEGFNAADHRRISVHSLAVQQHAEQQAGGSQIYRVRAGYDRLPEFLAEKIRRAGARIELSRPVERIEWRRGRVQVFARDGGELAPISAGSAIIALPLGVLQQLRVSFDPLPQPLLAAHQLAVGMLRRFTLLFRERWWADNPEVRLPGLSFLFTPEAMPPVWWTAHPWETRTLTGWIGGPGASAFDQCTREQIGDLACQALARIFSLPLDYLRAQLICCATHDWFSDPWAQGGYSYIPVGGLDAVLRMATPVQNTLFFAGEHTDLTGHWGTVHAALRSGLRAAAQALQPSRAKVREIAARPA